MLGENSVNKKVVGIWLTLTVSDFILFESLKGLLWSVPRHTKLDGLKKKRVR